MKILTVLNATIIAMVQRIKTLRGAAMMIAIGVAIFALLAGCADDGDNDVVASEGGTDCTADTSTSCNLDLTKGTRFTGTVGGTGDAADWIEVTFASGTMYQITVTTGATVSVYTAAGTRADPNIESNLYTAAAAGAHYIAVGSTTEVNYTLTVRSQDVTPPVIPVRADVDIDDDGLIEISTLEELNNMRYNLAGTSYKTGADDTGNSTGCPAGGCNGYELMRSLDFNAAASYADGTINTTWCPRGGGASDRPCAPADTTTNPGFTPIGTEADPFAAIFEGNGNTIANLYIGTDSTPVLNNDGRGFFGTNVGMIRNIGLPTLTVHPTENNVGGLVGRNAGTIIASWTSGSVSGAQFIGGLVGRLLGTDTDSKIIASYSRAAVSGSATTTDSAQSIGGLIGIRASGTSSASWAIGVVSATPSVARPTIQRVGGLVGNNSGSSTQNTGFTNNHWDISTTGRLFGSGTNDCDTDNVVDSSGASATCLGADMGAETNQLDDPTHASFPNDGLTTAEMQGDGTTTPDFDTETGAGVGCAAAYTLSTDASHYPQLKLYMGTTDGMPPAANCSNHAPYGAVLSGQ